MNVTRKARIGDLLLYFEVIKTIKPEFPRLTKLQGAVVVKELKLMTTIEIRGIVKE